MIQDLFPLQISRDFASDFDESVFASPTLNVGKSRG